MKANLLIAAICIFLFPVCFASRTQPTQSQVGLVFAGHTVPNGLFCTCGEPNCVTSPGECGDGNRMANSNSKTQDASNDLSGIMAILLIAIVLGYRIGK